MGCAWSKQQPTGLSWDECPTVALCSPSSLPESFPCALPGLPCAFSVPNLKWPFLQEVLASQSEKWSLETTVWC